jgi:hypothetical protein
VLREFLHQIGDELAFRGNRKWYEQVRVLEASILSTVDATSQINDVLLFIKSFCDAFALGSLSPEEYFVLQEQSTKSASRPWRYQLLMPVCIAYCAEFSEDLR